MGTRRSSTSTSITIFTGRLAAACVHPYAAWRVLPKSSRVSIVSAYAIVGYVAVLGTLWMF